MLLPAGRLGILAFIGPPARTRQGTLPAYTFLTGFMFAFACLVCGLPSPAEHLVFTAFCMTGCSRQDCSLKGTLLTNGYAHMGTTDGLGSLPSLINPYSFRRQELFSSNWLRNLCHLQSDPLPGMLFLIHEVESWEAYTARNTLQAT